MSIPHSMYYKWDKGVKKMNRLEQLLQEMGYDPDDKKVQARVEKAKERYRQEFQKAERKLERRERMSGIFIHWSLGICAVAIFLFIVLLITHVLKTM